MTHHQGGEGQRESGRGREREGKRERDFTGLALNIQRQKTVSQ